MRQVSDLVLRKTRLVESATNPEIISCTAPGIPGYSRDSRMKRSDLCDVLEGHPRDERERKIPNAPRSEMTRWNDLAPLLVE